MSALPRRVPRWVSVLVAAAIALVPVSHTTAPSFHPVNRLVAADPPTPNPAANADAVDWITRIADQINSFVNGSYEWQQYSFGNTLTWFAGLAMIAGVYGWIKVLLPSIRRSQLSRALLPIADRIRRELRGASSEKYLPLRDELRRHVRRAPEGLPHNRFLRANVEDEDKLEEHLADPQVRKAFDADPKHRAWLAEFDKHMKQVRAAQQKELFAQGLRFEEAATALTKHYTTEETVPVDMPKEFREKLLKATTAYDVDRILEEEKVVEFFDKKNLPKNIPKYRELRRAPTEEDFDKLLRLPEVHRFLHETTEGKMYLARQAWAAKYNELKASENARYDALKKQFNNLGRRVTKYVRQVDKSGKGLFFIAHLLQSEVVFRLGRRDNGRETPGTLRVWADGFRGATAQGSNVTDLVPNMDKAVRNAKSAAEKGHRENCRKAFWAFAVPIMAGVGVGTGLWLRNRGNKAVHDTTGLTGDDTVNKAKKDADEKRGLAPLASVTPRAIAARLKTARLETDEKELRDLYAILRTKMREAPHLPAIKKILDKHPEISALAKETTKYEERYRDFVDKKNNEAADATIDAALGEIFHGKAVDVASIKEILFSDDKVNAPFRTKVHSLLYESITKALFSGLLPDDRQLPITADRFGLMLKESMPDIEGVARNYRLKPKPTDVATPSK